MIGAPITWKPQPVPRSLVRPRMPRPSTAIRSQPQSPPQDQSVPAVEIAAEGTLDAAACRALDVVLSSVLLVLLSPVILAALVTIKVDSPGPGFYKARRVGWKGRELRMLKFRKMTDGAAGAKLTAGRDERFTRVGVWLTRLKLDEIPQLWHVLRGEMSLVGPRPEDPEFVALVDDDYRTILEVRPGITGYSQLAFAEEGDILDLEDPVTHYIRRLFPQKLGLDKLYASERSLWLNLRILCWTVAAVILRRPVAVNRETGKMNLRSR
jgi:lipopolysaccharide/colanic/teichoic acid biosynthesis glycosyltransferase